MTDDEIIKQNRDTLLERMNESGNAYSDEYPYGLMGEAEEEIKLLRKERDEARREICEHCVKQQHSPQQHAIDRGWDCFEKEEPQ